MIGEMTQNPFSLHFIVPLENQTRAPEFILVLILLPLRSFLYFNGNSSVRLRNNSANRFDVEHPTVWATFPNDNSVYARAYERVYHDAFSDILLLPLDFYY